MIKSSNKTVYRGTIVDSNNIPDLGSDYYFNRLISDTIYDMNKDVRNGTRKTKWHFLPSMEHLEELKQKFDHELEYVDCGDYVKVRVKGQ